MQKIIRNVARCKKCGDVIESKHRHDYVSCKCGAIAVDGGTCYIRWIFNDRDDIEDLCEAEE